MTRHPKTHATEWINSVEFSCLNPRVAFSDLAAARSIVLTSGTLSPLDAFQSELGAPFPLRVEANHVVGGHQVWAGVLGTTAHGAPFTCTFKHFDTYDFQDGLGDTILRLIRLIPAGVLVFLPSYSLIEKLVARWEATGVFGQMKECKEVYLEPKGTGKGECDQVIKEYQTSLRVGKNGAMIFAVYRGKLSEGIDFSDDQSRAVIGVGIPYANARDPAVVQKKKYNDSMASLGIMNG
ncbi:Fanconi anemia group J protein, partial [Gonapodya sp. JEL0774]